MLTNFTIRKTFNRLTISLYVDAAARDASAMVTYDRRILRVGEVFAFHEVATPEKAEAFLRRTIGERGTLVETLEWQARTGQLTAA